MSILNFTQKDNQLNAVIQQARYWQKLEIQVKKCFPVNLSDFYQVICIDQNVLIVFADNSMVASRLKMIAPALLPALQSLDGSIKKVTIKIKPQETKRVVVEKLQLGKSAIESLEDASHQLEHHPELAEALQRFAQRQKTKK